MTVESEWRGAEVSSLGHWDLSGLGPSQISECYNQGEVPGHQQMGTASFCSQAAS